jgi:hypothetical protein
MAHICSVYRIFLFLFLFLFQSDVDHRAMRSMIVDVMEASQASNFDLRSPASG